jgi:hypothetical protein
MQTHSLPSAYLASWLSQAFTCWTAFCQISVRQDCRCPGLDRVSCSLFWGAQRTVPGCGCGWGRARVQRWSLLLFLTWAWIGLFRAMRTSLNTTKMPEGCMCQQWRHLPPALNFLCFCLWCCNLKKAAGSWGAVIWSLDQLQQQQCSQTWPKWISEWLPDWQVQNQAQVPRKWKVPRSGIPQLFHSSPSREGNLL